MKKILVVDDEDAMRRFVATALRRAGYDTLEAAEGKQALAMAQAEPPALILSDVHMAGMDGYSLLRNLRRQSRLADIPVILMTGTPEPAEERASMERGADDYLTKPFTIERLLGAVQARLTRQAILQAHAHAAESRLLEILADTWDLVAVVEPSSGRLQYLNQAGRRMLGLGLTEDISPIRFEDFRAPNQPALLPPGVAPDPAAPGGLVSERLLISRDGRQIPVSEQVQSHPSPADGNPFLSVVARDISRRKKAERERQEMEIQLRQAQKLEAIGQLAAGIAHEINTPTQYVGDNTRFVQDAVQKFGRALRVCADLCRATQLGAARPELIDQADRALKECELDYLLEQAPAAIAETLEGVDRITRIVRAMKEFSHPGSQDRLLTNLNKAIETTTTVARSEWKYEADLVLELDPKLPLVPCYVSEFNQAILNLIINASHAIAARNETASGAKGQITITTQSDGHRVEIRVRDTGCGIPESIRPRIFEPFFTTKPVGKGTGQGLSIVYASICKRHGGTVRFETEVGRGTTFILSLPLEPTPEKPVRD